MALVDLASLPSLEAAQASLADATSHGHVSRETAQKMLAYSKLVLDAAQTQNLVSLQSVGQFWDRHIIDCAQLMRFAPETPGGSWIDLGSGAGFPGIVLAILGVDILLVEERRLRIGFLDTVCQELGLQNARLFGGRVERCKAEPARVITARAYAPIERLFTSACHLSADGTLWILPRGQHAAQDLATARGRWQGEFAMKPSITDAGAAILLARHVRVSCNQEDSGR